MNKVCACCLNPAEYSVVSIVSSVGITPRVQKCSDVVLFCASCLRKFFEGKQSGTERLRKAVNRAYTRLNRYSETVTNQLS